MKTFKRFLWSPYLTLGFRVVLGGTLVFASASKLLDSSAFVDVVIEHDILPDSLARLYGNILPWGELILGCLLILGLFRRYAASIGIILIMSFIGANAYTMYKGIDAECSCFGDAWIMDSRDSLIIDAAMLLMSLQILFQKTDILGLDLWRSGRSKVSPA